MKGFNQSIKAGSKFSSSKITEEKCYICWRGWSDKNLHPFPDRILFQNFTCIDNKFIYILLRSFYILPHFVMLIWS